MDTPVRYLTAREAADLLGVSTATLYSYVSRGLLRSEEIGGASRARRYHAEDVAALRARKEGRRDPGSVAQSALNYGMPVLESSITLIQDGCLYYRGYDALLLAQQRSVEAVAALIWLDRFDPGGLFARQDQRPQAVGSIQEPLNSGAEPNRALPGDAGACSRERPGRLPHRAGGDCGDGGEHLGVARRRDDRTTAHRVAGSFPPGGVGARSAGGRRPAGGSHDSVRRPRIERVRFYGALRSLRRLDAVCSGDRRSGRPAGTSPRRAHGASRGACCAKRAPASPAQWRAISDRAPRSQALGIRSIRTATPGGGCCWNW